MKLPVLALLVLALSAPIAAETAHVEAVAVVQGPEDASPSDLIGVHYGRETRHGFYAGGGLFRNAAGGDQLFAATGRVGYTFGDHDGTALTPFLAYRTQYLNSVAPDYRELDPDGAPVPTGDSDEVGVGATLWIKNFTLSLMFMEKVAGEGEEVVLGVGLRLGGDK